MENEIKTSEQRQKLVAIERTFNSLVSVKTRHSRTQNTEHSATKTRRRRIMKIIMTMTITNLGEGERVQRE